MLKCGDLRKTLDTLRWDAVLENLKAMGFSKLFIQIVDNYIQNTSFSVLVKGTPSRPFKSQRGLTRGD